MNFEADNIYHLYNRGNNRELLFHRRDNYLFFLHKLRKQVLPFVDILAYCLMPNHFHLMIHTKADFDNLKFTNAYRILLSSYTRAINLQQSRVGSLFQQNSKVKSLIGGTNQAGSNYPFVCFNYIHQNPLAAGLVKRIEDWEFSSLSDYIGLRAGTLCN